MDRSDRFSYMSKETVTLELPASLYEDLAELASEAHQDPVVFIAEWVEEVRQRRLWQQDWADLRAEVQKDSGFSPEAASEEFVTLTRRFREEIFEADYAHLYQFSTL